MLLFTCFSALQTAQAQFDDPFQLAGDADTEKSILSGGFTLFDLRHPNDLSDLPYRFNNALYTFRLSSGNQAGITFRYGTDNVSFRADNPPAGVPLDADVRVINAAAELGGRGALYRGTGDSETLIYVPVRVFADYFNVKKDFGDVTLPADTNFPVLNSLMLTGGLGLGFRYRTSRGSLVSNRIMIDAYATRSLGTNVQVEEEIFSGAARQDNLKAQLTFLDLFGGFSFVLGYEFRNAVFRQDGFHEFFSMLTEDSGYDSEYYAHTITLGIRLDRR